MTSNEELKVKIAEWAGIQSKPFVEEQSGVTVTLWGYDGEWRTALPNFPHDLNACEKYVWKDEWDAEFQHDGHEAVNKHACYITAWKGEESFIFFGEGECRATAFCRAVEQIIDQEVKSDQG